MIFEAKRNKIHSSFSTCNMHITIIPVLFFGGGEIYMSFSKAIFTGELERTSRGSGLDILWKIFSLVTFRGGVQERMLSTCSLRHCELS